jgi:ribosomal protein S20
MKAVRMWALGLSLLALGSVVWVGGFAFAGENKELVASVKSIAAAIKKGDKAGAEKLTEAAAKKADETEIVMDMFKIKKKGGIGVGPKETDGIDVMLRGISRDGPKDVAKNAEMYEEMAYHTAALAHITAKVPNDKGKKDLKTWNKYCEEMAKGSTDLAKAAVAKAAQDVKTAATQVYAACNNCHSKFK